MEFTNNSNAHYGWPVSLDLGIFVSLWPPQMSIASAVDKEKKNTAGLGPKCYHPLHLWCNRDRIWPDFCFGPRVPDISGFQCTFCSVFRTPSTEKAISRIKWSTTLFFSLGYWRQWVKDCNTNAWDLCKEKIAYKITMNFNEEWKKRQKRKCC